MRSRTAQWFECKVKYEKVMEDGLQKQVVEQYAVDALSFAEAEERITQEMAQYISGKFEVTDVKKAPYKDVFFDDADPTDARWYKAKVQFITIDEKTDKEKRQNVCYLVQACSVHNACENIDKVMEKTMIDYDIVSVTEQPIVDVFEDTAAESKAAALMTRMTEDLRDPGKSVEQIVDQYVKSATPELRQQLIGRLTEMRAKIGGE